MFLPVKHPEDLRFRLSRIGIDPSNDTEVVCGYGCLQLLEHIVRLRKWRLPFAAYKNEDVHRLLVGVFPEATKAFDRNLGSLDYWKSFADAYDAAVKMPAETFIRNVCPNFVTDPNICVRILSLKMSETKGDFTPLTQCLHLIFTWRPKSESMEQAYAVYEVIEKTHMYTSFLSEVLILFIISQHTAVCNIFLQIIQKPDRP